MSSSTKAFTGRTAEGRQYVDTHADFVRNDTPEAHIADPSAGITVDSESRSAIAAILDALEAHGLLGSA